jgi:hypothetical protein
VLLDPVAEAYLLNTPCRSRRIEHVERNTSANFAYLLWEARYLNGVAQLSKGLDVAVRHTEFAVARQSRSANGVLMSGQRVETSKVS